MEPWIAQYEKTFQYMTVRISEKRLDLTAVKPDGQVLDHFQIEKEKPQPDLFDRGEIMKLVEVGDPQHELQRLA